MTRQQIITELKKYFIIEELVCPHMIKRYGKEVCWQFLDTEILHTLLVLRTEILNCPMVINDYAFGGKSTQRGVRCNICQIVKDKTLQGIVYMSAHCNGAGLDIVFGVKTGMTAEKARNLIKEKQHLLPYDVRIERGVTWLHIDCYYTGKRVFEFNG